MRSKGMAIQLYGIPEEFLVLAKLLEERGEEYGISTWGSIIAKKIRAEAHARTSEIIYGYVGNDAEGQD
jgi:hypothetical protein